jgi:hypothetical protein
MCSSVTPCGSRVGWQLRAAGIPAGSGHGRGRGAGVCAHRSLGIRSFGPWQRLPRLVSGVAVACALLLTVPAASALAASLSLTASPNPAVIPPYVISGPNQGGGDIVVSFGLTGTSDRESEYVDLYLQLNNTAYCAATTDEENAALGGFGPNVSVDNSTVGQGPFTASGYREFGMPATYRLCAYLTGDTSTGPNSDSGPPDATATLVGSVVAGQPAAGGGSGGGGALACVVPRVIGRKLAAARTALRAAHCRAGKITNRKSKRANRGRVLSQSVAAGRRRPVGASVNLVVGR